MLKIIIMVLTYLPDLLRAVKAVEVSMEGQPGAAKKAVVIGAVEAAAKAAGESGDVHVKAVGDTVDVIVKTLNTFGWGK
jgi:hypothetical protein